LTLSVIARNKESFLCPSTKQKVKRKPFYIRILPVVALVIVWMILPGLYSPQCEHDFHERTVFKPSTTSDGLAEKMCAKCYESDSINLPRLENIIDAKVTEKTADYLEYGGTLDSIELNRKELKSITFSLELTNTGDVSVKNLTGSATVYNQNDEELGSFQFQMSSEILPGETVSSEAEKSYFWMLQADPLDKLYANQLASADLNELRFDFEIQYE